MIPRFRPYIGKDDFFSMFRLSPNSVREYEEGFAKTFTAEYAIAFPYGRVALWSFLKALRIENAEIIIPAYTCVVVAHAIVLSGNIPRFVDIQFEDYNMNLAQVENAINEKTGAVICTHLFGYPMNAEGLNVIVKHAESRYHRKIYLIQDCAHAFGACRNGKMVCNSGDAAIFGLGISKTLTSIFGGMLTTSDNTIHKSLINFRNRFTTVGFFKQLSQILYFCSVFVAFNNSIYSLVHLLETQTSFLDALTKSYHLDDKIHFPPDYLNKMSKVEAGVGLCQLKKYPEIIRKRREIAEYYSKNLSPGRKYQIPPLIEGATYSHYVLQMSDKHKCLTQFRKAGIQLGEVIQYSIPNLQSYRKYADAEYPVARSCAENSLNLPIYPGLHTRTMDRIITLLNGISKDNA